MDWEAWARRFEQVRGPDSFEALFAAVRTFQDPVTAPTADVRAVAEHTDSLFPDWHQRVETIRGGDSWAVFEWTGTGTFSAGPEPGAATAAVTIEGATVITVDEAGLVTTWRDYLDTAPPTALIVAALEQAG